MQALARASLLPRRRRPTSSRSLVRACSAQAVRSARRAVLAGVAAGPLLLAGWRALAEETVTFYGAANPPATYGGVGGTTRDKARYSLVLPSDWTEAAVSKVDKGASGIDSKFVSSGRKKQSAFVTTLRNEGSREGSGFKLSDPKVALATVAGSLYLLQDAIGAGTVTSSKRGESFVFDLRGPTCGAFEVRTSSDGRLFAIFVLAPAASWDAEAAALVAIRDSFTVY